MVRLPTLMIFFLLCVTKYSYTQNIRTLSDNNFQRIKSENGLTLTWLLVCSDSNASQVDVFDEEGRSILGLNVLRLVPDALRVSIYDVSARPGREIAVAAVYRKAGKPYVRPVATLLNSCFAPLGHVTTTRSTTSRVPTPNVSGSSDCER